MKGLFLTLLTLSITVFFPASGISAQQPPPPKEVIVEGIVYNPATDKGIPSLTVQLVPPRSVKSPRRVLRCDEDGKFRFQDKDTQKYVGKNLLEVYDGSKLLFRKEIDTSKDEFRRIRIPIK
jgi:hypothetical protein